MEIWKEIKGYEGYYLISNMGRVKSQSRKIYNDGIKGENKFYISEEKIINGRIDPKGYLRVALCKDNKQKDYSIHRLVAIAFIPNPNNKPCVNHKDGNKQNNNVENLEWCTYSENLKHAYKMGLKKKIRNIDTYGIRLTKYNTYVVVLKGKNYKTYKTYEEARKRRDELMKQLGIEF